MSKSLKLTIIIATYNSDAGLEKSLISFKNQNYFNKELIVIDGGSNDKTLQIVKKYKSLISYFVSEKDNGIPDAYNKGIKVATGDWIFFLNADDVFFSKTTLKEVSKKIYFLTEDIKIFSGRVVSEKGRIFRGKYNALLLFKNTVHHQGLFYRKNFLMSNKYNCSYKKYGHDYEHNLMIWKNKINVSYTKQIICKWALGGISDIPKMENYILEFKVRKNILGKMSFFFNAASIIRFLLRKIRFFFSI